MAGELSYRLSFGHSAELYNRSRPQYAVAALHWALGAKPIKVADLGAGTGILTRQLIQLGHHCVAIEPDPKMRAVYQRTTTAPVLPGCAENIPLPDASADAVVAGESYHWFDNPTAHAEIARILRPQGVFAPMWNIRDEKTPWVAELIRVLSQYDQTGKTGVSNPVLSPPFDGLARREFPHVVWHTVDTLLDLYRSYSYYIAASPARRRCLEEDVRRLVESHRSLAGGQSPFMLPYFTVACRACRADQPSDQ